MADYMATSTLVVLLKKSAHEIDQLRINLGEALGQSSRLLAGSCTLVKPTCNSTRTVVTAYITAITGRAHFVVGHKVECEAMQ
jgi:hypothetical protein